MGFKKGQIPWNKGKTMTEEFRQKVSISLQPHRKKLSEGKKGKKNPMYGKKPWNYGKKPSVETLKKMSRTWFKKGHKPSSESVKKVADQLRGKKRPRSVGRKISQSMMGSKNPMYGKTGELHHNYGTHHSEESKRKNSESKKKWYANGGEPHNKGKTGVISDETRNKIRIARSKQKFPNKDTSPEKLLQKLCKNSEIEFEKQKLFDLEFQMHPVDVFIEPNICLEADGDRTHANPNPHVIPSRSSRILPGYKANYVLYGISKSRKKPLLAKDVWEKDEKIDEALEQQGNVVLRFLQSELETEPEKCLQKIIKIIKESKQ